MASIHVKNEDLIPMKVLNMKIKRKITKRKLTLGRWE